MPAAKVGGGGGAFAADGCGEWRGGAWWRRHGGGGGRALTDELEATKAALQAVTMDHKPPRR